MPHVDNDTCVGRRCNRQPDRKPDGTLYAYCKPCRKRRALGQRRARARLVAQNGCRRCAYRQRLPGDFLCERCRVERDLERAELKEVRRLSREIDDALRETARGAVSNEDAGVSKWNARKPKRPAAGSYWSPEPDPKRELDPEWAAFRRFRRC